MNEEEKKELLLLAQKSVSEIVLDAIEHTDQTSMLVIFDTKCELSRVLSDAYQAEFPKATFLDYYSLEKQQVLDALEKCNAGDLVVLVQSEDFRLSEFRIRLHLFERDIKVVDHRHLLRNNSTAHKTYIQALGYDKEWYRGTGRALERRLNDTNTLEVKCGSETLTVLGGLEEAKPNLGDYKSMKNIGGTFPIGEVFTEARDFGAVNGSLMIYAFADVNFNIEMREPFRIDITEGIVTGWADNAPQAFVDVIEKIKTNERPLLRELGFGLNRAITRENYLNDITAFERILGMHVSLGEKHTVYKKEGIRAKKTRFHVDVFLDVDEIVADGEVIFKDRKYLV